MMDKNVTDVKAEANAELAKTCCNLGALYANTNRPELAIQEFLQAKAIYEQLVISHPSTSTYLPHLAEVCKCLGNLYSGKNRIELTVTGFSMSNMK